jgi:hypothetical protein
MKEADEGIKGAPATLPPRSPNPRKKTPQTVYKSRVEHLDCFRVSGELAVARAQKPKAL